MCERGLNCKQELIHITIFAGFTAHMVIGYYYCLLKLSLALAYFSTLQSLLASFGVILALLCQSIMSEMTRICHEDAT